MKMPPITYYFQGIHYSIPLLLKVKRQILVVDAYSQDVEATKVMIRIQYGCRLPVYEQNFVKPF